MKKATVFFTLALAALILFVSCGEDPFFHDVTVTDRDKVTTEIVFNGNEYTLPANSDAEFLGWKVDEDKYIKAPGEKVTVNGDVAVKAIYTDTEDDTICLLMYVLSDSNYTGSFTDSSKKTVLVPGDKETLPKGSEMKSNGGNFDGWYTAEDADGNRKYYEGGSEITVTSFTKLYANWIDPKLKYEVSTEDSTVTVSADDKTATSYKISSWYQGDKVTVIGDFSKATELTSVTIPSTIETISGSAFSGCSKLTSCNLPDGLETIGNNAFSWCDLTGKIVIPASVTSLGSAAFSYNTHLTEYEFEAGNTITALPDSLFEGCDLTGKIVIPASLTSLGTSVFKGNTHLTEVEFESGSTITAISEYLFEDTGLTYIDFPSNVASIGYMSFKNTKFINVIIPASVTSVASMAFAYSDSLETVDIKAEKDTAIGENAFVYCPKLEAVTIGPKIVSIGSFTFSGSSNNLTIAIQKTTEEIKALPGYKDSEGYVTKFGGNRTVYNKDGDVVD